MCMCTHMYFQVGLHVRRSARRLHERGIVLLKNISTRIALMITIATISIFSMNVNFIQGWRER